MTTGYLGNISNFNPILFYKIENNTFKIVPENSKDSKPCLIDTGFFGNLILPNTGKNRKISIDNIFYKSEFKKADLTPLDVQFTLANIKHRMFEKKGVRVALADIPRAIIGMQLLQEFDQVTFDFNRNSVSYKI